jgi:hypothetical protein
MKVLTDVNFLKMCFHCHPDFYRAEVKEKNNTSTSVR